jgi:hypothetical protein
MRGDAVLIISSFFANLEERMKLHLNAHNTMLSRLPQVTSYLRQTAITAAIVFVSISTHLDAKTQTNNNQRPQPTQPTFEPCPEVACGGSDAASVLGYSTPLRRAWRIDDKKKNSDRGGGGGSGDDNNSSSNLQHISTDTLLTQKQKQMVLECPPDRAALGLHAWSFVSG